MNRSLRPSDLCAALAACLVLFACGDDGGGGYMDNSGGTGGGVASAGGGTGAVAGGTGAVAGGTGAVAGGTGATTGGGGGTVAMDTGACNPTCISPQICAKDASGVASCMDPLSMGEIDMQCVTNVVADGSTMDCATCLCTQGTGCLSEIAMCDSEPECSALVECSNSNICSGDCCLCGDICDDFGLNLTNGPCVAEIGAATGLGAINAGNGGQIEALCNPGGGTACAHSNELGDCNNTRCGSVCNPPPSCP